MEQLSFASDNELLNAAKVTSESTPTSATKMLYEKMFGGISDVFDPRFLALISHLACFTKQQISHSLDDLEDSLRKMFLMVSHMLSQGYFLFL